MGKSDKNTQDKGIFEVRFSIRSVKNPDLYKKIKEMADHLYPIKSPEVVKYIIEKAYEFWYSKEVKKKLIKS